jgi:hypothetical protein
VCSELEAVWLEAVMVQYTRIFTGGNEVNNKATQLTIAGLWAEISNVKQECHLPAAVSGDSSCFQTH